MSVRAHKNRLAEESNDIERDACLTSTFFILDTVVKADYLDTLKWGEYYLGYLAAHPELPADQRKPRSDILKRLEIINENCDMFDRAL